MKKFYREIIIVFLFGTCIWLGSDTKIITRGYTDPICSTDTVLVYKDKVIHHIKGESAPKWLKISDTVYIQTNTPVTVVDSGYIFADVPVNEYMDSTFYARTVGWLDSIAFTPLTKTVYKTEKVKELSTLFLTVGIGSQCLTPSLNFSYKKTQIGFGYNTIQKAGVLNLGYRLK